MTNELVKIDGSMGEGGGQVLRSSLALSLITQKPFHIVGIRAGRKKPGLLRQHLTAVKAAARIGAARVQGAELKEQELLFEPTGIFGGSFEFAVGTAGSTTLVLQAVLPALLLADRPSELMLEGGTHNPFAPPFDFLERSFLPVLRRMGAKVNVELIKPGFFPAGGGKMKVRVDPVSNLEPLELLERGSINSRKATARSCNLNPRIAKRELETLRGALSWSPDCFEADVVDDVSGPGNIVVVEIESEQITEVFTGFGRRERRAEQVAGEAVLQVREYLASEAPVGSYLADQLLIPMALAKKGKFKTVRTTKHCRTNIDVIESFLNVKFEVTKEARSLWRIEVFEKTEGFER